MIVYHPLSACTISNGMTPLSLIFFPLSDGVKYNFAPGALGGSMLTNSNETKDVMVPVKISTVYLRQKFIVPDVG